MPVRTMTGPQMMALAREELVLAEATAAHRAEMVAAADHLLLNAHEHSGCPICRASMKAVSVSD